VTLTQVRAECRALQRGQRRRHCPLSGDDATGGFTVPLPPRSLEVGEADSFAACAWTTVVQAALRGPALLATVAEMSQAAKPKAEGVKTRESRAVVSVTVSAMRRSNCRVLGGWLRSQLASAAHVAERGEGQ